MIKRQCGQASATSFTVAGTDGTEVWAMQQHAVHIAPPGGREGRLELYPSVPKIITFSVQQVRQSISKQGYLDSA